MKAELKITVDQLKNYLGTGLKFHSQGCHKEEYYEQSIPEEFILNGISGEEWVDHDDDHLNKGFHMSDISPLCYRLSDLDKFIPELGFVPTEEFDSMYGINRWWLKWDDVIEDNNKIYRLDFRIVQKLFEWNFWPFGDEYFEKGLVIDKLKEL